MQNILEYITHDYCQGKEICLLFEELPGDRLWQSHSTLQFATGSTSFDPTSLCDKSVCYRCLQFRAKEPETCTGEITWGAVASTWWGCYSGLVISHLCPLPSSSPPHEVSEDSDKFLLHFREMASETPVFPDEHSSWERKMEGKWAKLSILDLEINKNLTGGRVWIDSDWDFLLLFYFF